MRYDKQGRRKQQVEFSEKIVCYAMICMSILIGTYAIIHVISIFCQ